VSDAQLQWLDRIHVGDCRALMRRMIADGVRAQCIVTSPPYWGLRDYGVAGQFGLERTWTRHVARMRGVFRLARQVLADDGVLWLNYGDCYAGAPGGMQGKSGQRASRNFTARIDTFKRGNGLKPKDLVGMPWRIAFALQTDGWWLRSEIIWHKPNPMPESITDRPTKSHEQIFLFARSSSYYYNLEAIAEPVSSETHARAARGRSGDHKWADGGPGTHTIAMSPPSAGRVPGVNPKARRPSGWAEGSQDRRDKKGRYPRSKQNESMSAALISVPTIRNARTVWTIPTEAFGGAHFATFPRDLVRRCVLAGSRVGDIVFDPFMGSGTVAQVADELGRRFIGCELNADSAAMYGRERPAQMGAPL
jgi:site-specific DNA-methyltransferase (cytosine-N4-specific)